MIINLQKATLEKRNLSGILDSLSENAFQENEHPFEIRPPENPKSWSHQRHSTFWKI